MKIYRVEFDATSMSTGAGIVKFPEGCSLMPPDGEPIRDWPVPLVDIPADSALDFMPSNIRARVCSQRLVELLSEQSTVENYLQWCPIKAAPSAGQGAWKVLHFSKPLAVLDRSRSRFLHTGALIKPAFDRALIKDLPVFSIPGAYMFEFFVSEKIHKEAKRRKIRGFFTKLADDLGV